MNILFTVAEVAPYSKAGGLGDVAGSLPKELAKAGNALQVISPLYKVVRGDNRVFRETGISGFVRMNDESYPYRIVSLKPDPDFPLEYLFVANSFFFDREGIYTRSDGEGYQDNNTRFFFFQYVIIDLILKGYLQPELIHLNDHHTALIALLLKVRKINLPTILTVHNFQYQGNFQEEDMALFAEKDAQAVRALYAPETHFFNALRIGLLTADRVNTVSPTYARELLSDDDLSYGLSDTLKSIRSKFSGILNGVDYDLWNPAKDPYLTVHYSFSELEGKAVNKKILQEDCGLPVTAGTPLIGSVSRLVESKGFDLILSIIDDLMELKVQMVFLGTGSIEIEKALSAAAAKYPRRIAFRSHYSEKLAHLIEAGSDMFLMPSRFEPCGLNQIYSLKYGTIPIVHKTGGLADTIR
ncbi:MAG: glycosyltransferase, partial [FCB group bacterium]|nr:glycosyltransferase [FCB group bacterium]